MKRTPATAATAVSITMLVLMTAPAASAQDLQPPAPENAAPPAESAAPENPLPPIEEAKDTGLGLEWVYFSGGGGGAYTNMTSLNASNFQVQQAASSGGEFDFGAGVRLLFLSAGLRARNLELSAFNLWELDAEAALHMRVWRIDPYLGARGGYVTVGGLNAATSNATSGSATSTSADSSANVHGFNVGPMFGIDIYLTNWLTLGAEVNVEFLILERPPIPIPASIQSEAQAAGVSPQSLLTPQQQQLYQQSGSSAGVGAMGAARLGIHF
jgi:hypothetical protein